ncbi:MAG: dihydrodipicolinate synthase family protein [Lachnospiraceae bacterium]|nr:dihydrodipicolinate synthase family protein [Lachnospiraceae bacterium]
MNKVEFPGGVWPVMLTPFTEDGRIDYNALEHLVNWYIDKGCDGLFAVCQSSEMYYLTLEERLQLAEAVVKITDGRVPVIASGNICDTPEERIEEANKMAKTGVDAIVLISNSFAEEEESDKVWMANCLDFLEHIDSEIPLGFYECPYPYKRLLSLENLKTCAETGRFYFLKDTCCDADLIQQRLDVLKGTNLKLYNANTSTLLETLRAGAVGFSGVMANFHPELYVTLCKKYKEEKISYLQDFLTLASLIERQYYPVNAKYHLQQIEGIPMTTFSRRMDDKGMTETFRKEVKMMDELAKEIGKHY